MRTTGMFWMAAVSQRLEPNTNLLGSGYVFSPYPHVSLTCPPELVQCCCAGRFQQVTLFLTFSVSLLLRVAIFLVVHRFTVCPTRPVLMTRQNPVSTFRPAMLMSSAAFTAARSHFPSTGA